MGVQNVSPMRSKLCEKQPISIRLRYRIFKVCIATFFTDALPYMEAISLSSVIPRSVERQSISTHANSSPDIDLAKSMSRATRCCMHQLSSTKRRMITVASVVPSKVIDTLFFHLFHPAFFLLHGKQLVSSPSDVDY